MGPILQPPQPQQVPILPTQTHTPKHGVENEGRDLHRGVAASAVHKEHGLPGLPTNLGNQGRCRGQDREGGRGGCGRGDGCPKVHCGWCIGPGNAAPDAARTGRRTPDWGPTPNTFQRLESPSGWQGESLCPSLTRPPHRRRYLPLSQGIRGGGDVRGHTFPTRVPPPAPASQWGHTAGHTPGTGGGCSRGRTDRSTPGHTPAGGGQPHRAPRKSAGGPWAGGALGVSLDLGTWARRPVQGPVVLVTRLRRRGQGRVGWQTGGRQGLGPK